jgi:hypothetical protein
MRQTHVPEAAPTSAQFYTAPRPRTAPTAFLRACPEASGLARIIHERARMIAEDFAPSARRAEPQWWFHWADKQRSAWGKRSARAVPAGKCNEHLVEFANCQIALRNQAHGRFPATFMNNAG